MGDTNQVKITLQLCLSKCKSEVAVFSSISLNIHLHNLFQIRLVDISYMYNRQLKCIQILLAQFLEKYPL
jgi:hypothetical protein